MKNVAKKRFLLIAIAFLCVAMLFAYSFESEIGDDHEYGGRLCSVCLGLFSLENIRNALCVTVPVFLFVQAFCLLVCFVFGLLSTASFSPTPVCLKVKLSN